MSDLETVHGWFSFREIYNKIAYDAKSGDTIVELGVWQGKSIIYLAQKLKEYDKRGIKLFGIDSFLGGNDAPQVYHRLMKGLDRPLREVCEDNIARFGVSDIVTIIESDSEHAASMFNDSSVDFLFIDTEHTAERLRIELDAWLPKMRRPCWIAGDDYFHNDMAQALFEKLPQHKEIGGKWIADL